MHMQYNSSTSLKQFVNGGQVLSLLTFLGSVVSRKIQLVSLNRQDSITGFTKYASIQGEGVLPTPHSIFLLLVTGKLCH